MTETPTHRDTDAFLEAASHWHARLSEPGVQEADWLAFAAWSQADPRHADAYRQLVEAEVLAEMALLDSPIGRQETAPALRGAGTAPAQHHHNRRRFVFAGIAAAAAATFAFVSLFLTLPIAEETPIQILSADAGRLVEHRLKDGSAVTLNGGSRLAVRFRDDVREVALLKGEALFEVASNKTRPFEVQVGAERVRVIGTVFSVEKNGAAVEVILAEGRVDILPSTGTSKVSLSPNQAWRMESATKPHIVRDIDADKALLWTEGELVYTNALLSEVFKDLERQSGKRFHLAPGVGTLRFSGTLRAEAVDDIKLLLTRSLPIVWKELGDKIEISKRAD